MSLSDQDIAKFQQLYKHQYGTEISKEEAYEQGIKLVRLMALIYKPMTEKEHHAIRKRRVETVPLFINQILYP